MTKFMAICFFLSTSIFAPSLANAGATAPPEETTLCSTYPDLTPQTADQVIGTDASSVSYASLEKVPGLPASWTGKKLIVNGLLYIDEPTTFLDCVLKMGPGARLVVQGNQSILGVQSVFFACDQMWEGIKLEEYASGGFFSCQFEDANNAISSTKDTPLNLVSNRFNRNQVGLLSSHANWLGYVIPTALNVNMFVGNEFTVTGPLNALYPGQYVSDPGTIGIKLIWTTSGTLIGPSGAPNTFSNLFYGIWTTRSVFDLGYANFTSQEEAGIYLSDSRSKLTIAAINPCTFNGNGFAGIHSNGADLDVNGSSFGGVTPQAYGIYSAFNTYSDQNITFCHFTESPDLTAAIFVERGDDVNIYENTFDLVRASYGIWLVQTSSIVPSSCNVQSNNINIFNPSPKCSNVGIYAAGGTAESYTISNNDIDIRATIGPLNVIRGIYLDQVFGPQIYVSDNNIGNGLNSGRSSFEAISVKKVTGAEYCYNNTLDAVRGMSFFGNCNYSFLYSNYFNRDDIGLLVSGDAGSPAIIGIQNRGANVWEPGGFTLAAAICTGNPAASLFRIHSPLPQYFPMAPMVIPSSGWFVPNFGPILQGFCGHVEFASNDQGQQVESGSEEVQSNTVDERTTFAEPIADFVIQPNPATDLVQLNFGKTFTGEINLLNSMGQVLKTTAIYGENSSLIDTKDLPNGVYFVQLRGENQPVSTKKLVVQH